MSNLFWLTEEQMERLTPFYPKSHGKPRVDDRRVLSGMIFINRNGLRWCDARREYGPPKTLYNRWKRWGDMGVFARMMEGSAAEGGRLVQGSVERQGDTPMHPRSEVSRQGGPLRQAPLSPTKPHRDHVRSPERLAQGRLPL